MKRVKHSIEMITLDETDRSLEEKQRVVENLPPVPKEAAAKMMTVKQILKPLYANCRAEDGRICRYVKDKGTDSPCKDCSRNSFSPEDMCDASNRKKKSGR